MDGNGQGEPFIGDVDELNVYMNGIEDKPCPCLPRVLLDRTPGWKLLDPFCGFGE